MDIRKVGIESITIIRSLAHITWPEAYKEILTPEQMTYMLELIYSEASLKNQVAEHQHQFIIVADENVDVGFASYSLKNKETPLVYRLHKIYITPGQQGKGIGKLLLNYVINDIKINNATALELNVNRYNKALLFYQKSGFKIISREDIPIGNNFFMNDYVLKLSL